MYKSLLRPLLFQLKAEQAHTITLKAVQKTRQSALFTSLITKAYNYQSPLLSQNIWGLSFRNPVGLAAGFDKNGYLTEAMENIGMGFTEVGSITAQANNGNPKPRLFRLPKDRALINRMGLNNDGAERIINRLQDVNHTQPLGVNIAKTPDPAILDQDAINDYLFSYKEARSVADYITVNISCPNTADGKTFEDPPALDELLNVLLSENRAEPVPTLVKFSADLSRSELEELVEVCEAHPIDGYVACNTSSNRSNLATDAAALKAIGRGGLSGAPLTSKSVRIVKWLRSMIGGQKPIIGVGGIHSYETALQMLQAGANLLQVYTGLIYEGPALVKKINRSLAAYMQENGLNSLKEL